MRKFSKTCHRHWLPTFWPRYDWARHDGFLAADAAPAAAAPAAAAPAATTPDANAEGEGDWLDEMASEFAWAKRGRILGFIGLGISMVPSFS